MLIIWLGFFISISVLMILSRKNFWLALMLSAILLGSFSMSPLEIFDEIVNTLEDYSIILMALAVGIIPLIGGALDFSGLIDTLIRNLRIKQNLLLAFSSALMGMLPMPGGALLSAPVIKKAGKGVSADRQAAINIWFRHLLLLVYPFGALLPTTKMAGINVYRQIVYLFPGFFLMLFLGYLFLLKDITGGMQTKSSPQPTKILKPLGIILIAPLIHVTFITLDPHRLPEFYLVCAVATSFLLSIFFGHISIHNIKKIILKMKPWKYSLIIIGMFLFLNIFTASDTPGVFETLNVPKIFLLVVIGFLLGFATGRVQLPVSILLPVYLAKYGVSLVTPVSFGIMFFSVYIGYLISPVHPCVAVSLTYFHTGLKNTVKHMIPPAAIGLLCVFLIALFVSL